MIIAFLWLMLWASPASATVPEAPAAHRYIASGGSTSFAFGFRIDQPDEVEVLLGDVTQTLWIHYTVSGMGSNTGGLVQFHTPPAANTRVTILRRQPLRQASVYFPNEPFPARRLEADLDNLAKQVQMLAERLDRALSFPKSMAGVTTVDPPTVGQFARAKVGGGIDWATPGSVNTTIPVPLTDGGTGATSASQARVNLGVPGISEHPLIDAKGDLLVGAANDQLVRVPIGTIGQVLTVNPATTAGVEWQTLSIPSSAFVTGDIKFSANPSQNGWIPLNDGTIGSAASGATTRANADTEALYTLLWNQCADLYCPVTGGRGASAAADFAANKPLRLPRVAGRAIGGVGVTTRSVSGTGAAIDTGTDMFTVPTNPDHWVSGPVTLTYTGSLTCSPACPSGSTFYVIRMSNTTIKLASSIYNAQKRIGIDIQSNSVTSWTLSSTWPSRSVGETTGWPIHYLTDMELAPHTHEALRYTPSSNGTGTGGATVNGPTLENSTDGRGTVIMSPTVYLHALMKL